jgi:hypothetical protein
MAIQSNSKTVKAKTPTTTPAKAAAPAAPVAAKPAPVPAVKVAPPAAPTQAAAKSTKRGTTPTIEEIQTRAFEIYVSEGCKEGNDLDNWLRAEKELRAENSR